MRLFEDKVRVEDKPAKLIDNRYDFYDRSAWPWIEKVRNILNYWFSHYPEKEQYELKCRFQKEFNSALYELFIYELFLKQGFNITVHPSSNTNAKTKPDFLLSRGGIEFYVEAKVATGKSDSDRSDKQRINVVYDSINSIKSSDFMLCIEELKIKTHDRQPSTVRLKKHLKKHLLRSKQLQLEDHFDKMEKIEYDDEDLFISYRFFPISPDSNDKGDDCFIGIYPCETHIGGNEDILKKSLEKKAGKYGILKKPYLICINSEIDMPLTDKVDADDAIWGSLQVLFSKYSDSVRCVHVNNGFFKNGHTRVSGVLITCLSTSTMCNPKYWMYENPNAINKLNFDLLELNYFSVVANEITQINKKQIGDILALPNEWSDLNFL